MKTTYVKKFSFLVMQGQDRFGYTIYTQYKTICPVCKVKKTTKLILTKHTPIMKN